MDKVVGLVNQTIMVATGVAKKATTTTKKKKGRAAAQGDGPRADVDSKLSDGPVAGAGKSAIVSVDVLIRIVEDLSRIH